MLRVGFAGTFSANFERPVRGHLATPREIIVADEAQILPRLKRIEVLVTMTLSVEMGRLVPRLKLVQVPGVGLDGSDRSALPQGALLANAYGHESGVGEYVIGAILALTCEFSRLDKALRQGDWQSQWAVGVASTPAWPELAGKTIGILGYGWIGQSIARRARAFDMQVCAIRRDVGKSAKDDLVPLGGAEMLEEVLRRSDYVVVSMPATQQTIGWIDHERFRLLKPSAFLINVAGGEIINEDALYHALSERQIAGAAVDVWYRYPREEGPVAPATHPFHELPNVLMTPHVSRWTDGTLDARARLIAENIRRVAGREVPLNLASP
jgi:phosphoglycerate dehydrogenase-like enzyme